MFVMYGVNAFGCCNNEGKTISKRQQLQSHKGVKKLNEEYYKQCFNADARW